MTTARERLEDERIVRDAQALADYNAFLLEQENTRLSALYNDINELGLIDGVGVVNKSQDVELLIKNNISSRLGVAVKKVGDVYRVMRHIQANIWIEYILKNSGELAAGIKTPYKIVEQAVRKLEGYITVQIATDGGTWSQVTSVDSAPYTGHVSKYTFTNNNTLTFSFVGSGDIYLSYTKSTDCGIFGVSINGGVEQLIDSYSATTNNFKQEYFLGNVSSGTHTIVIRATNTKNAASTNYRCWISALRIYDKNILPDSALIKDSLWAQGVTYAAWAEVRNSSGNYYVTSAGGTSGATEPIHATGAASDGGVTWSRLSSTSYSSEYFRIQAFGSELEYAYEFTPAGETVKNDVGGNLHGNEYLKTDLKILVDGLLVTNQTVWNKGDNIEIVQDIADFYGTYGTHYDFANVKQSHFFNNQNMIVNYKMSFLTSGNFGYFYSAMWPFLVYDAYFARKQFIKMFTPQYSARLSEYQGVAGNPLIGLKKDYIMAASGRAFVAAGAAGVPTSDNGKTGVLIALKITQDSVNSYLDADKNAALAVNGNAGVYTGYSSWLGKMYFQRYKTSGTLISAGHEITASNVYSCVLFENLESF